MDAPASSVGAVAAQRLRVTAAGLCRARVGDRSDVVHAVRCPHVDAERRAAVEKRVQHGRGPVRRREELPGLFTLQCHPQRCEPAAGGVDVERREHVAHDRARTVEIFGPHRLMRHVAAAAARDQDLRADSRRAVEDDDPRVVATLCTIRRGVALGFGGENRGGETGGTPADDRDVAAIVLRVGRHRTAQRDSKQRPTTRGRRASCRDRASARRARARHGARRGRGTHGSAHDA